MDKFQPTGTDHKRHINVFCGQSLCCIKINEVSFLDMIDTNTTTYYKKEATREVRISIYIRSNI